MISKNMKRFVTKKVLLIGIGILLAVIMVGEIFFIPGVSHSSCVLTGGKVNSGEEQVSASFWDSFRFSCVRSSYLDAGKECHSNSECATEKCVVDLSDPDVKAALEDDPDAGIFSNHISLLTDDTVVGACSGTNASVCDTNEVVIDDDRRVLRPLCPQV